MTFSTAKRTVMALFSIGVLLLLIALIAPSNYSGILLISGITIFAMGLVVVFKFCKCPSCGSLIFRKLFVLKVCPNCKRDLVTGAKVKNKHR